MLTTVQKFYLLVYLVKVVEVEELVKKLEIGKRITKETVVADSKGYLYRQLYETNLMQWSINPGMQTLWQPHRFCR